MPYSGPNDSSLPKNVKKLSTALRSKWVNVFNTVFKKEGEEMAFIVANKMLLREASKPKQVAKSLKTRVIKFDLDTEGKFIKKSADGEEYVSFTLADTLPDGDGESFTAELLQKWADDINAGNVIVGDFDHKEYDNIVQTSGSSDEIGQRLRNKQGVAKTIKAVFEKGKLWVKALIDKRYRKIIEKAGVSLEAYISDSINNVATEGRLDGFSFMINEQAANPRLGVAV